MDRLTEPGRKDKDSHRDAPRPARTIRPALRKQRRKPLQPSSSAWSFTKAHPITFEWGLDPLAVANYIQRDRVARGLPKLEVQLGSIGELVSLYAVDAENDIAHAEVMGLHHLGE